VTAAGAGDAVVVVVAAPADAARAGETVQAVEASGRRAALFLGDPRFEDDRAALLEMLDELFASRD
jgi:hypothetical protein